MAEYIVERGKTTVTSYVSRKTKELLAKICEKRGGISQSQAVIIMIAEEAQRLNID